MPSLSAALTAQEVNASPRRLAVRRAVCCAAPRTIVWSSVVHEGLAKPEPNHSAVSDLPRPRRMGPGGAVAAASLWRPACQLWRCVPCHTPQRERGQDFRSTRAVSRGWEQRMHAGGTGGACSHRVSARLRPRSDDDNACGVASLSPGPYTTDAVDDVSYLEEFINPTLLPVLHDLAAEVRQSGRGLGGHSYSYTHLHTRVHRWER